MRAPKTRREEIGQTGKKADENMQIPKSPTGDGENPQMARRARTAWTFPTVGNIDLCEAETIAVWFLFLVIRQISHGSVALV